MEQPPSDDEYGPIRDPPNMEALRLLSWKQNPPCPSRELAFSKREGSWKYSPCIGHDDPLGGMRESTETPATSMVVSDEAWGHEVASASFLSTPAAGDESRTRNRLEDLNPERQKKLRLEHYDDTPPDTKLGTPSVAATVASEGTSSSPSP